MGARGKGNGGGYPALAMDGREGACSDGDCEGDPMLAIDTRHVDNKNGMFGEAPLPLWGRRRCTGQIRQQERRQTTSNAVTSKGATRGRGQGTGRSCDEMRVEALGNGTTNQMRGA